MADIKKSITEFEKDIVKTIIKKKGSIIASEKVMRYMEDKIRSRVSADKLLFFSQFDPMNDSIEVSDPLAHFELKHF